MGKLFHGSIKLGIAILLSGAMGNAIAYQHGKAITSVETRVAPANMPRSLDKVPVAAAGKPEKCYLALHLEMVGTPFAARIADTGSGMVQQCDADLHQKAREKDLNLN